MAITKRVVATLGLIGGITSSAAAGADKPIDVSVEPVRTACQEVQACRPSCDGVEADEESQTYAPIGVFAGSFTAPRAQEAIVSLFPCGETFSRRQAGVTALVRKDRKGWRTVGTIEDAVSQGECRLVDSGGRQLLLCQVSVGPDQGIMTDALCVVSADERGLDHACPLRVTDVRASGCFSDSGDTARPRHTWAAEIKSWAPATVAGSPGARVEVSLASQTVPPGDNLDPPCQRATERLEKASREVVHLELAFAGRKLSPTAESRKAAARSPWAFDFE